MSEEILLHIFEYKTFDMPKKLSLALALIIGFTSISKAQLTSSIADSIMANSNNIPYIHADTTSLPDGVGVSYSSLITHSIFGLGDTIQSANDIATICMNIEHSYIADLIIQLECPNGLSTTLADLYNTNISNGNTFLGEAAEGTLGTPGIGWNYCLSELPFLGTMADENINQYWDTSIYFNSNILKSGLYKTEESLDSLIGCPLNGDWKIIITDNAAIDDGFIFNWQLNFDTLLFPANYNAGGANVIASGGVPPYNYFWSNGATTSSVNRLAPGTYTVQITDSDTINKAGGYPNKTFSSVIITEDITTYVEVNLDEQLSIYPNPIVDELNISFNNPEGKNSIKIYTLSGVLLKEENNSGQETIQVSLQNYPQGIYFVEVKTEGETFTKKIIKQ